ncbi:MAG: lysylphosphatidylglycerol synthase transmembrane domain-containing protein [Gaiellaceae bacterium]
MDAVVRAAEALFDHLAGIEWQFVALAALAHLAKMVVRTRAWRNILAAASPELDVRWRTVFGAYVAGVGVNAIVPARGGDVLKLYLVKRGVPGSSYPTLAATLVAETLFDIVVASALLIWALSLGVLPGVDVIPLLPDVDWLWLFEYPRAAVAVGAVALAGGVALGLWASRRIAEFWLRVGQGFAILRSPGRYLRLVVPFQALDWVLRLTTIYLLLVAFGMPATLHNALLVQVAQSLATILPLTPAGIGTEQALLAYVFAGIAPALLVLGFSVGMKLTIITVNVAAGSTALLLMLRTLRWRRHAYTSLTSR